MGLIKFAVYFFICQFVYDVIFGLIKYVYIERKLKKIRLDLHKSQTEGVLWN